MTEAAPLPPSAPRFAIVAIGAFMMWGAFPLYFRELNGVDAWETLACRIFFSLLFVLMGVLAAKRFPVVRALIADRRKLALLTASAVMIAINWGTFIWAVGNDRTLEASLGYYSYPLVAVFLGRVVLRERLNFRQGFAVFLAVLGVANLALAGDHFPVIALLLSVSFAVYGLIRKIVHADSLAALLLETAALSPLALGYIFYVQNQGTAAFGHAGGYITLLLVVSGLITAMPLFLFGVAARGLSMATIGLLQYLAPSGQFLIAVFVFGEPFQLPQLVTFGLIWAALLLYSADPRLWGALKQRLSFLGRV